jgi:hypothetical protein
MKARLRILAASVVPLVAPFLVACTGSVGDGNAPADPRGPTSAPSDGTPPRPGQSPPATPGGPTAPSTEVRPDACKGVLPGPSPLRRLTRTEYANTVRDLLGDQNRTGLDFPAEERLLGFDNNAEGRSVSPLLAERYFAAAGDLAKAAVTRLPTLLSCDPGKDGEAVCLDRFLDGFARRAWRRPLEASEKDNLRRTFNDAKGTGATAFSDGIDAVIQVLLLSPQFMYRVERGRPVAGAQHLQLSAYEVATRLSYLYWASMPDDELFAAAEAGKLSTREQIRGQAERMLRDPRAAAMVATFADGWLRLDEIGGVEKQTDIFPSFKPELRASMRLETQKLIEDVMGSGEGKLGTLLTANYSFMNGPLAAYYGIKGPSGDAFTKVPLDPTQRAGVLGHAGLLALLGVPDEGLTSLVFRGLFVREHLLCQPIADPPAGAADMSPPFTPTTTARQWSEARQGVPLCGSCHKLMDPIGFAFEHFDGVGAWRADDRGTPVDAHGELSNTDVDGPFEGLPALAQKLAGSTTARQCLATQWFRYGYGRQETDQDACTVAVLQKAAADSGGNFRELLLALSTTDAFLFRSEGARP